MSWQRERRAVQKAEAFSTHSDPVEQTIEEVGGSPRVFHSGGLQGALERWREGDENNGI